MSDYKKCTCPLCEQSFTPADGLTPEEHLAIGIIKTYRQMQDVPHEQELPCPRCGHSRMKCVLENNAFSRLIDVYICPECGIDEALRDTRKDVLPFVAWFIARGILQCLEGISTKDALTEK